MAYCPWQFMVSLMEMVEHRSIRKVLPCHSATEGHPDYVAGRGEKRLTVVRVRRRGQGPCWVSASWLTWVILKWQVTNMKEHRREVCNVCMRHFIIRVHAGCKTLTSPLLPIALVKVLDIPHPCVDHSHLAAEKRNIIKPWDQFQRFTHWWFGVAHVQGWLEGESFSIQLSFRAIEENLADIMIQHVLLWSRW